MAWQAIYSESITEGPANKSAYQNLDPNEGAHVYVKRTDTPATVDMIVQIWGSIDGGTTESDIPLFSISVDPADDEIDFPVSGPLFSIAIGLGTIAGDAVTADIKIRPNGGLG